MTHQHTTALNIGQEAYRLASMPADDVQRLEKAVLLILSFHTGRKKAISGQRMLFELNNQGITITDTRYFREVINGLRKQGWPIGSTGGKKGGYWLCENWAEFEAFVKVQIHDFAMDLLAQEKAMRNEAARMWGPQMSFVS